jgi:hypothetical protein
MSVNTHTYQNDTGFIRIDGDDIIDGEIDIQTALNALNGTSSTLSYLLKKEDSDIANAKDINYPIKTREGCWEVLIPFGSIALGALVLRPLSAGLTEYAKGIGKGVSAKQLGAKDNKKSFESAFEKLLIIIKIAQHLGVIDNKRDLKVAFSGKNNKALLTNQEGQVLSTTLDEIKLFQECPDKLLLQLASVVTDYRTLSIGYRRNDQTNEVVIDRESKEVFCPEDEIQEPILPELKDGDYVSLEGFVTRGNQVTNTLGFRYEGHVLTCEPVDALITGYIQAHYKNCLLKGRVARTSKAEVFYGKRDRPKIFFDSLEVIEKPSSQTSLLT